ncbi:MAG: SUMF1/EgtB/PvdO family nonheme iron enzyme [Planctomycetota bacterium]
MRLERDFKYCPNCAYRLRPEIVPTARPRVAAPALGDRLVALGGYLAFASMLLLVVFAGFRLFLQPETGVQIEPRVILTRDPGCLPLPDESFRLVEWGEAHYGAYESAEEDEEPVLPEIFVVDDPFRLCIHEITNDQYYDFLLDRARKSGRSPRKGWLLPKGWRRHTGKPHVRFIYDRGAGDLPVTGIYYQAALEFCAWYWEERLGADPDLVVDLPRPREYLRAARGDRFQDNYPWGRLLRQPGSRVNLDGDPLPVTAEGAGEYDGFHAQVGNAAEWVHGYVPDRVPMAAGWSHLNALYLGLERKTPFGDDGFLWVSRGVPRAEVGFRILIRDAPAVPTFEKVDGGTVHHVPTRSQLLRPPPLYDDDGNFLGDAGPVTFSSTTRVVPRQFEMARTEITNRQYLFFLTSVSMERSPTEMGELLPSSWQRTNPWNWRKEDPEQNVEAWEDTVYLGLFGNPWKVPRVYEAGRDNHPVMGVSLDQVRTYAAWLSARLSKTCRLPTVAEYLRAGRGAGKEPYPWGTDPANPLLACSRGATHEERTVSFLGRNRDRALGVIGLVGNLPEYVWDGEFARQMPDGQVEQGRFLLAGGCYRFPPELCTLDSFMDATWEYVEFDVTWPGAEETFEEVLNPLRFYAGFRLVRELGLF